MTEAQEGAAMSKYSRRDFLRKGALGLATLGAGGLILRANAGPTETSGDLKDYPQIVKAESQPRGAPTSWKPTQDNILGPFYRKGAPYRAKVTPPLEPGKTLLISGRVWGFNTRKPLAHASIDIWQANAEGRYDNSDPNSPPAKGIFKNRARLITDETGYYEYETVHPGHYQLWPGVWRPSHVHYLVQHPGYQTLITQLYFRGDPHNAADRFIKESLIIDLHGHKVGDTTYQTGTFDIVLAPAKK